MTEDPDLFERCLKRSVLPGPGAIPLERFLEDDTLDATLAPMRRRYPDGDPRAIASLWVKLHCRAVIEPLSAHLVRATTEGGTAPKPVGLVLQDAEPECMAFTPDDLPHADALADAVLRGHLVPLFEALRQSSRLSVRVAWSNVGNLLEWALTGLAADPRWAVAAEHWRAVLIGAPRNQMFPAGNPLHAAVRTVVVAVNGRTIAHRRRRVCCLRDRLPGLTLCGACPRLTPDALAGRV